MNWNRMVGLVVGSLLILIGSCTKETVEYVPLQSVNMDKDGIYANKELRDPVNNVLKDFGQLQTKVLLQPVWVEGDMLTVYSLDKDDVVLWSDVCTVYNIRQNVAKIKAEVHKDSYRYLAVYPYNHFNFEVGEKINLEQEGFVNHTGLFGDESIMTSFCSKNDDKFLFSNRYSLLRFNKIIEDNLPIKLTLYYKDGTNEVRTQGEIVDNVYYSALSWQPLECPKITVDYKKRVGKKYVDDHITIYPKSAFLPGHIYDYELGNN